MAINIQEILHPSDSNQIKWEKVNYNFDQILANGGGPTGKKGAEGAQGSVGQTGQKGQKGDIGPQGETGATTSRWKVIPINQDNGNTNEYVILKPKLSNDDYHPVIFLGDQTFDEVNNNDGLVNLRATLTIGKHAQGGDSASDELLTYWHGPRGNTGNNISITLGTSEQTDGSTEWTRYELGKTFGIEASEVVEYFVNLDKYTFQSSVGFDDDVSNIFRLPGTSISTNNLVGGEIRYYADTFWGAVKDSNGNVEWKEFCTAPCGAGGPVTASIAIEESPADLILNQYGGQINQTVEIVPSGDIEIDNVGNEWNGNSTGATTTLATTSTTLATTTEAPDIKTIEFAGGGQNFNNVPHTGGNGEIGYVTGPITGLIVSNATKPSWVEILSYQDNTSFSPELNFKVEANGAGARSGVITIAHPEDPSVTATLAVSQVADPNYGAGCTDPNADNYDPNAGSDDGSCTYCANFTAVESSKNNPSSYGASDGSYAMTATGGSANYDYSVYRTSDDQQVNPFALTAGTYYGVITDLGTNAYGEPMGCTDRIDFTLTDPATSATTAATNATAATTAATNATAATTAATNATAATTLAATYSAISANPSGSVNEGQQVTVTVTGNNIINGTRVWVNMNLGSADQLDITSGWSSGAGSGDSPSNSSWGNWVTMNNNTGSHTITIKNDNLLEGGEIITFSLLSYDEAGNATGSKQTSVTINDTSYPQTHTVTFINGNTDQYSTCQLTNNTKTATYAANPNGQATWTTIANAIMNDSDYAGSGGVWFKIVSSTEPGFQWNNTTANHSAPITGQDCSNVTTTSATTTAGSGGSGSGSGSGTLLHTISNYGNNYAYITFTDMNGTTQGVSVGPYNSQSVCAVPGSFGGNTGSTSITNNGQTC